MHVLKRRSAGAVAASVLRELAIAVFLCLLVVVLGGGTSEVSMRIGIAIVAIYLTMAETARQFPELANHAIAPFRRRFGQIVRFTVAPDREILSRLERAEIAAERQAEQLSEVVYHVRQVSVLDERLARLDADVTANIERQAKPMVATLRSLDERVTILLERLSRLEQQTNAGLRDESAADAFTMRHDESYRNVFSALIRDVALHDAEQWQSRLWRVDAARMFHEDVVVYFQSPDINQDQWGQTVFLPKYHRPPAPVQYRKYRELMLRLQHDPHAVEEFLRELAARLAERSTP